MTRAHVAAAASVFFAFCVFTPLAHAQATRTWVSGVGDDANPCSRTAPCRTWGFAAGSARGIEDDRTSGHLLVTDTVVSNNAQTGILALAGSASSLNVSLDRVQMHSNGNAGLAITNGTRAIVTHSSASSNTHGFYADGGSVLDL